MISPEAKADASTLGLDDNEHALLEVAKLPATAQCAAVKEIVDRQRAGRARLASGAVVASNKKAAAKIQAIEADIAKKKEAIESLKEKFIGRPRPSRQSPGRPRRSVRKLSVDQRSVGTTGR